MCFAPQRRALFRHLDFQKWSGPGVFCTFWPGNVLRATTACTFSTSQLPKVVRDRQFFTLLTWKCASRHNGVHFFDISTSKSGPKLRWFVHFDLEMCFAPQRRALFDISTSKSGPRPTVFYTFDLEMCFAPQRRALFWHLNFQKWSEPGVFWTFWLGNVLRATTACTFSTSKLPKVSEPGVFWTFWLGNVLRATTACNFSSLIWPAGSAPAALASLLFEPPEPQIIGKTQCFATFLPFRASASSFFWLFLFSDLLSSNLSLLSPSALLCFSSVHIVGSLTSKLPSIKGCLCLCLWLYIYIYSIQNIIFIHVYVVGEHLFVYFDLFTHYLICTLLYPMSYSFLHVTLPHLRWHPPHGSANSQGYLPSIKQKAGDMGMGTIWSIIRSDREVITHSLVISMIRW